MFLRVTNRHIWGNSTIIQVQARGLSHISRLQPCLRPSSIEDRNHHSVVNRRLSQPPTSNTQDSRRASNMATAATTTNGTATNGSSTPDITLYTNHACPWAHRAHIALKELGLPYKEEIIDLDRPRDPWYLKINPRGLVPSINYNGHIITESATVTQFLADAHPSQHLLPTSASESNALFRARVAFFVDTFISKALPQIFNGWKAQDEDAKDAVADEIVTVVVKEVEPLFDWDTTKGPYFGGSDKPTLAEVQTGPFVLRLIAFTKPEYGILSPKLAGLLKEKAPKFTAWATKLVEEESVTYIWNEKLIATRTKERFAKLAATAKV